MMFSKDDGPAPNKFCPSMCAWHTFFFSPCNCALCNSLDLNIFSSTKKIHIIELKSNDVVFAKGTSSNRMETSYQYTLLAFDFKKQTLSPTLDGFSTPPTCSTLHLSFNHKFMSQDSSRI